MSRAVLLVLRRTLVSLWRLLPRHLRWRPIAAFSLLTLPRISALTKCSSGPTTVVGLVNATTGPGEGARLCYRAFRNLGLPVSVTDVTNVFRSADYEFSVNGNGQPATGGALIVHVNPPHFSIALSAQGRSCVSSKKVIAYWAWELPVIPDFWSHSYRFLHEIWVPSHFVADAITASPTWKGQAPVRVVPHPVEKPECDAVSRSAFGIDEHAFVALMIFHMGAGFARKNPIAGVRAFFEAFGDSRDAQLVIAVRDAHDNPAGYRELLESIGSRRVLLLHEKLSRPRLNALIAASDVVLSLHRSEGFGLVLAESMAVGKPVVATGWSGNLEYMTPTNSFLVDYRMIPVRDAHGTFRSPNQVWADPDASHAAAHLRRLFENRELARTVGETASREAAEFFALDRFRSQIGDSFEPARPPRTTRGVTRSPQPSMKARIAHRPER